jgi:hypothetical protein
MAIRIDVATRIVVNVRVLIQRLRLCDFGIRKRLLPVIATPKNEQFIRSTLELVGTGEAALDR